MSAKSKVRAQERAAKAAARAAARTAAEAAARKAKKETDVILTRKKLEQIGELREENLKQQK